MFTVSSLPQFVNQPAVLVQGALSVSSVRPVTFALIAILVAMFVGAVKLVGRIVVQIAELFRLIGSAVVSLFVIVCAAAVFTAAVFVSMH